MKLIDPKDRLGKRCYFCGTEKSVKYTIKIVDPVIPHLFSIVSACNKCAVLYNIGKETRDE